MEPIAIVGMACRFPGAPSLSAYWTLLSEGRDAIVPVPAERWDADAMYADDPKASGKTNTRHGGFIDGIDRFDAAFFSISPREAVQMDPQQRILLELAHEAFEDAGCAPTALAGSDTAVYIGVMSNDYLRYQTGDDYRRIDVHTGGGAGHGMLANRLSYQFDLHGPSMAIDSACSASLVTVFQGCQALWTGQSALALAGGVNLMLDPAFNIFYAKGGLMAPDGRCKTFSAEANGIGRGEGAGLVVLKRESDALRDGDNIYAVIRGGAINHGGRSNGVTAPNRWAQEKLVRSALRHAQVRSNQLQYIELHGTGTAIGDPIEANALGAVLKDDGCETPCLVGSVKSNIGHLEGAAGVAGLIKLALSLHHRAMPASLGFDHPNPAIDFENLPLAVNAAWRPWPAPQHDNDPLLAGINSFGLGGTNAHLVLASAPRPVQAAAPHVGPSSAHLMVLSARSEAALRAQASQFQELLEGDIDVAAMCMTLLRRRSVHDVRLLLTGHHRDGLRSGLAAFLSGSPHAGLVTGRFKARRQSIRLAVPHTERLQPAALAPWLQQAPHGRDAWQSCRELLMEFGDQHLPALSALARSAMPADEPTRALWCFAGQYAMLMQLIATLPNTLAVVADGQAQLAAACAAGAMTLSQALGWLRTGLNGSAPATGNYRVRCDFSGRVDPALDDMAWRSDPDAWAQRVRARTGSEPAPLVVQVNLVEADEAASVADTSTDDSLACIGTGPRGFADLFARLGLHCALRWEALADMRFTRLPSYPWQREPYLLPKPVTAGAHRAGAPSASATATAAITHAAERRTLTASLRAELLATPRADRGVPLQRYLRERIGEALRLDVDQIDPTQPLNMLGIDSLTAVEIKSRIERDLRLTIPVVRFLGGDAVDDFVAFLLGELNTAATHDATPARHSVAASTGSPPADIQARIAAMSNHQIDDLLAQLIREAA